MERRAKWIVLAVLVVGLVILAMSITPPTSLGIPPNSQPTYIP
jgi:hypothetical protein